MICACIAPPPQKRHSQRLLFKHRKMLHITPQFAYVCVPNLTFQWFGLLKWNSQTQLNTHASAFAEPNVLKALSRTYIGQQLIRFNLLTELKQRNFPNYLKVTNHAFRNRGRPLTRFLDDWGQNWPTTGPTWLLLGVV